MATDKKKPSIKGTVAIGTAGKLQPFSFPAADPSLAANAALENAKQQAEQAQRILDTAPVGSDLFKKAQADFAAIEQSFPQLQAKAQQVTATADATKATQTAKEAQARLADLEARAAAGSTSAASQLDAAKKAVADAQAAASAATGKASGPTGPKATGPTGAKATGPAGTKVTAPSGPIKPAPTGTKATGAKATGAATGSTGPKTSADFMAQYGIQAALIDSDPSLKKLFADAMAGGWDVNRFKAEFLNTSWAKNNSATWQNAETARVSAPGDYANSYNRMREYIARVAAQNGETLTPDQIGPELKQNPDGSWPTLARTGALAEWALDQSWGKGIDAEAIAQHIAQVGKINTSLPGGQAGNYMSQLKSLANDYGLNGLNTSGGSNYFTDAAQSILLGKSTIDTWRQDIINQAKQNYKAYAPQLDAGISLRSLANPYINSLSNLLEVPADSIDLSASNGYGKMVSDALRGTDPNNPNPMTLNQFETQVKQDPRWGYTNNARDSVMGGVSSLLKMFGKIGA